MTSPSYNTFSPSLQTPLPTWNPLTAFAAGTGAESGNARITSNPVGWGPYFGSDLLGVPAGDPSAIPTSQESGGSTGGWQTGLGQFIGATIGALFGTRATQQTGGEQRNCPMDYREGFHRDPATCQWIANTTAKKIDWWIWALLALLVLLVILSSRKKG